MSDVAASYVATEIRPRVAVLEEIGKTTLATLERIERRLDTIEANQRGDTTRLAGSQWSQFRWLLGIMLGGFVTTIGGFVGILAVIAHGFHWI